MKDALLAPDSFSGFLINLHFKVSFLNLEEPLSVGSLKMNPTQGHKKRESLYRGDMFELIPGQYNKNEKDNNICYNIRQRDNIVK